MLEPAYKMFDVRTMFLRNTDLNMHLTSEKHVSNCFQN